MQIFFNFINLVITRHDNKDDEYNYISKHMTLNLPPNIPNMIVMIRPNNFGFNHETAKSNLFQNLITTKSVNEKVSVEFNHFVDKLIESDIRLKIFDDSIEALPDAVFSNNWITHLPSGVVTVYPLLAKNRRREVRQDIIDWVMHETKAKQFIDLQHFAENNLFLEGTGSIVFSHEHKLAFACESERTSIKLFEDYCGQIGYTPISFESLDLNGNQIYHTNVMMSVNNGFCIICLDSIQNTLERSFLTAQFKEHHIEIINLSYLQMNCFAANSLEVLNNQNEACLIMSTTAYNSLTKDQVVQMEHYAKIIRVDITNIERIGGGGVRCMLTGLFI